MGHSQSRDARGQAQPDEQGVPSTTSSPPPQAIALLPEPNQDELIRSEQGTGSRKRQRSTSLGSSTLDREHPDALRSDITSRQRRRIGENDVQPGPRNAPDLDAMDLDGDLASLRDPENSPIPSVSGLSHPPSSHNHRSLNEIEHDSPADSDLASTLPSALGRDVTPPPDLDPLHEERDRARRRILEVLLATENSAPVVNATPADATAASSTPPSDAPVIPQTAGDSHADSSTPAGVPVPPEVLASLLQQGLPSSASTSTAGSALGSTSSAHADSSTQANAAPQPNQPPRRAPLHPSALSGTSMIVQGALVARTIPSRRVASEGPSHRGGPSRSSVPPSSAPSSSTFPDFAPGSQSDETNMPNSEEPRAVTLEEQAVMLSRILGIAAAATAASLVNTPGAQQVDRALLQSSLQPPFTPLGQATRSRGSPELSNWRRSLRSSDRGRARSPSSASSSQGLGTGLRERFAAFTQRVRSASETFGRGPASARERANTAEAVDSSSNQQEIISRLIDAANREAEARASPSGSAAASSTESPRPADRPRTLSASLQFGHRRSRSDASNNSGSENSGRSLLSRFMRETLGQFISGRPARFDSAADSTASSASQPQPTAEGTANNRSDGFSREPNDVAGTLQQVRNGVLPDGVAGSFGSFLNHLLRDLMVAVQSIQPASAPLQQSNATSSDYFEAASEHETTNGAEMLDAEGGTDSRSFQAQAAMLRPETRQTTAEDDTTVDAETRARRQRDLHEGNLSFFRLFRFEPVAPSALVPCIVIGVRSLDVTERLGEELAGARAAADTTSTGGSRQQTSQPTTLGTDPERSNADGTSIDGHSTDELPASRFLLFVSGGRYPANHPLLNSHPTTAGRDLMILMDLLGTMQAMQSKPPTVSQQEIDSSELQTIRGSQVAELVSQGKITENMAERCLVCLEDWQSEEECRLMACRHVFHTQCVDRWMTSSSNTCPMCRRQGVAKDGNRAGGETAESRTAPQI